MKDHPPLLAIAPQETAAPRTQQGVCSAETGHECTGCDLTCASWSGQNLLRPRAQGEGYPRWWVAFCGLSRREAACVRRLYCAKPAHVEVVKPASRVRRVMRWTALGGLPQQAAHGSLEIKQPAPTVARRVVLVYRDRQVPGLGIVRSQDSTERSWFKVSRFCYMLMKYSCDRRPETLGAGKAVMISDCHATKAWPGARKA